MNKLFKEVIYLDEYYTFNVFYTMEGGMGKVSIGIISIENQETTNFLAIKRIKNNNKIDIEKFKNESQIWISLKHPNIVKALAFMEVNDEYCLIMEPVLPNKHEKNTLDNYLNDSLTLKQILNWSIQFCYAMIYLNSNGVSIHRDIKPSNIMISDNILKVTDFGIAKAINIKEKNHIRLTGTLEYQAPETFEGEYTNKSDIYSWGIVLYQMINKGKLPYELPKNIYDNPFETQEIFFKDIHNKYNIPPSDTPLSKIICKCLNKNPLKRYNNFEEILNDLIDIYGGLFNDKPYKPIIEEFTFQERILQINSLMELDKKEEAISLLNSIEENKERRHLLSYLYYKLGDIKKSLDLHRQIILNEPNNYEARYGYATRLHETGNYLEAEVQYNIALKIKPNDKKTLANLGNLIRDMYAYEEALTYYNKVLEIDSNFFMAKFNKAMTFIYMERYDDAEKIFDKLQDDKRYTKKFKLIKAIETSKINQAKGSALLYNLKKEYPEDEEVLFQVAYFHFYYGRYETCLSESNKVLEINPENKKVKNLLKEVTILLRNNEEK